MSTEVLDVLQEIQAGVFRHAAPLPLKTDDKPEWQALAYQLGGIQLASPLDEVEEILQMPRMTHLPGTKDWVLGIANVRGRLVPIVDTHRYLGIEPTVARLEWRVLVLEDAGIVVGLVIEQSLGMQYFLKENFQQDAPDVVAAVQPHVNGAYRHGGGVFYVMNLKSFVGDDGFFDVAENYQG